MANATSHYHTHINLHTCTHIHS